jgi:hypothetical protein
MSSGSPQRAMGMSPPAMRRSYFSCTEAVGEEHGDHRNAGLRDAVFAAADGAGVRRARGDVHDVAADAVFRFLPDHAARSELREEQRALRVDVHHEIVAFLGHLQQVAAHLRRHARHVDQHVEAAVPREYFLNDALAVCAGGKISGKVAAVGNPAEFFRRLFRGQNVHGEHEISFGVQFFHGGEADSAGGAGDESGLFHSSQSFHFFRQYFL